MPFETKFLVGVFGPPLLLLPQLLLLAFLDDKFIYAQIGPRRQVSERRVPPFIRLQRSVLELVNFLLTPTMLWCFKMVTCSEVNGVNVLGADSSIVCNEGGHAFWATLAWVIVVAQILAIVFVLVACGLRWRRQRKELGTHLSIHL